MAFLEVVFSVLSLSYICHGTHMQVINTDQPEATELSNQPLTQTLPQQQANDLLHVKNSASTLGGQNLPQTENLLEGQSLQSALQEKSLPTENSPDFLNAPELLSSIQASNGENNLQNNNIVEPNGFPTFPTSEQLGITSLGDPLKDPEILKQLNLQGLTELDFQSRPTEQPPPGLDFLISSGGTKPAIKTVGSSGEKAKPTSGESWNNLIKTSQRKVGDKVELIINKNENSDLKSKNGDLPLVDINSKIKKTESDLKKLSVNEIPKLSTPWIGAEGNEITRTKIGASAKHIIPNEQVMIQTLDPPVMASKMVDKKPPSIPWLDTTIAASKRKINVNTLSKMIDSKENLNKVSESKPKVSTSAKRTVSNEQFRVQTLDPPVMASKMVDKKPPSVPWLDTTIVASKGKINVNALSKMIVSKESMKKVSKTKPKQEIDKTGKDKTASFHLNRAPTTIDLGKTQNDTSAKSGTGWGAWLQPRQEIATTVPNTNKKGWDSWLESVNQVKGDQNNDISVSDNVSTLTSQIQSNQPLSDQVNVLTTLKNVPSESQGQHKQSPSTTDVSTTPQDIHKDPRDISLMSIKNVGMQQDKQQITGSELRTKEENNIEQSTTQFINSNSRITLTRPKDNPLEQIHFGGVFEGTFRPQSLPNQNSLKDPVSPAETEIGSPILNTDLPLLNLMDSKNALELALSTNKPNEGQHVNAKLLEELPVLSKADLGGLNTDNFIQTSVHSHHIHNSKTLEQSEVLNSNIGSKQKSSTVLQSGNSKSGQVDNTTPMPQMDSLWDLPILSNTQNNEPVKSNGKEQKLNKESTQSTTEGSLKSKQPSTLQRNSVRNNANNVQQTNVNSFPRDKQHSKHQEVQDLVKNGVLKKTLGVTQTTEQEVFVGTKHIKNAPSDKITHATHIEQVKNELQVDRGGSHHQHKTNSVSMHTSHITGVSKQEINPSIGTFQQNNNEANPLADIKGLNQQNVIRNNIPRTQENAIDLNVAGRFEANSPEPLLKNSNDVSLLSNDKTNLKANNKHQNNKDVSQVNTQENTISTLDIQEKLKINQLHNKKLVQDNASNTNALLKASQSSEKSSIETMVSHTKHFNNTAAVTNSLKSMSDSADVQISKVKPNTEPRTTVSKPEVFIASTTNTNTKGQTASKTELNPSKVRSPKLEQPSTGTNSIFVDPVTNAQIDPFTDISPDVVAKAQKTWEETIANMGSTIEPDPRIAAMIGMGPPSPVSFGNSSSLNRRQRQIEFLDPITNSVVRIPGTEVRSTPQHEHHSSHGMNLPELLNSEKGRFSPVDIKEIQKQLQGAPLAHMALSSPPGDNDFMVAPVLFGPIDSNSPPPSDVEFTVPVLATVINENGQSHSQPPFGGVMIPSSESSNGKHQSAPSHSSKSNAELSSQLRQILSQLRSGSVATNSFTTQNFTPSSGGRQSSTHQNSFSDHLIRNAGLSDNVVNLNNDLSQSIREAVTSLMRANHEDVFKELNRHKQNKKPESFDQFIQKGRRFLNSIKIPSRLQDQRIRSFSPLSAQNAHSAISNRIFAQQGRQDNLVVPKGTHGTLRSTMRTNLPVGNSALASLIRDISRRQTVDSSTLTRINRNSKNAISQRSNLQQTSQSFTNDRNTFQNTAPRNNFGIDSPATSASNRRISTSTGRGNNHIISGSNSGGSRISVLNLGQNNRRSFNTNNIINSRAGQSLRPGLSTPNRMGGSSVRDSQLQALLDNLNRRGPLARSGHSRRSRINSQIVRNRILPSLRSANSFVNNLQTRNFEGSSLQNRIPINRGTGTSRTLSQSTTTNSLLTDNSGSISQVPNQGHRSSNILNTLNLQPRSNNPNTQNVQRMSGTLQSAPNARRRSNTFLTPILGRGSNAINAQTFRQGSDIIRPIAVNSLQNIGFTVQSPSSFSHPATFIPSQRSQPSWLGNQIFGMTRTAQ